MRSKSGSGIQISLVMRQHRKYREWRTLFRKPYLIKELPEGVRVGILGLTTPYIPNWENPESYRGSAV